MTRTFCDKCDQELTEKTRMKDDPTVKVPPPRYPIEISVEYHDQNGKKADLCKYCIIDAFTSLDDRPKQGGVA